LSLLAERLNPKRERALVVHRIDRFVSGALLFAKTSPDRNALVQQFLDHTPVRRYLAVLRGRPGVEVGTLVHYFRLMDRINSCARRVTPERDGRYGNYSSADMCCGDIQLSRLMAESLRLLVEPLLVEPLTDWVCQLPRSFDKLMD